MVRLVKRTQPIEFRGERKVIRQVTVYAVQYRFGTWDWRALPTAVEFFRYAEYFQWGEESNPCRQLAASMLYAYWLKEKLSLNGKSTALEVEPFVETFALRHLVPMKSASWNLKAKNIADYLNNQSNLPNQTKYPIPQISTE